MTNAESKETISAVTFPAFKKIMASKKGSAAEKKEEMERIVQVFIFFFF
jgi:hypothetical protein